ncbi:MAG: YceI family protein [Acidimicrobiia bacterium]|nr:YceI family protein [Acidimicrobiia bacterium]
MSRPTKIAVALLAIVAVVGAAAWWLGFFEEPAAEVSIEEAAAAAEASDNADPAAGDSAGNPAGSLDGAVDGVVEDLTGSWTIVGGGSSFVGYRIDEVLTTVGDFSVVGRTEDVVGTIDADDTTTAAALVADMTTLTTDNGARDRAMRNQALETGQFPEATFVLTSPIDVAAVPAEGDPIEVTATGELTIHGVTRSVEFPLTAATQGSNFVVIGQLDVLLDDYDIAAPSAPIVASVEDNAILELSLVFERS